MRLTEMSWLRFLQALKYIFRHHCHECRFSFSKIRRLMLVAFAVVATSSATSADPRRFFQADSADAAAYTLPDPLIDQAGRKITTAAEWEKTRRPEVLELFREHIYGRVPATPYRQTFTIVNENPRDGRSGDTEADRD